MWKSSGQALRETSARRGTRRFTLVTMLGYGPTSSLNETRGNGRKKGGGKLRVKLHTDDGILD